MSERKSAADHDLRLRGLNHFTVPVRDLNVAHKFYCDILGGVVTQPFDWERHRTGRAFGAHADIQMFDGAGHLITYWQPWGQPAADQAFPHRAFLVRSAEKLDEMRTRLDASGVPSILVADDPSPATPTHKHSTIPVSLFFQDPDGNKLALHCNAYPLGADVHQGTFDPSILAYPWADWRAEVPDGGAPEGPPVRSSRG